MTTDERFELLWTDFLEGELSADRMAELQMLLAEQPHLQARAADLLETHRLLGLAMRDGEAGREAFTNETLARFPRTTESFVSGVMQRVQPELGPRPRGSWLGWTRLAAAAAVVLLASVLGAVAWWRSGVEVVQASADAVPALHAGGRVRAKDLKLFRGEVRLRLASGVVLNVTGPAEIGFVDAMHLRVNAGRVAADVGGRGKGFVIETPQTRVVDLGTRFSVNVLDAAHTDVAVSQGRVELFEGTKRERVALLNAGDAVRVDGAGKMSRIASGQPEWALGPFARPPDARPILRPDADSVFDCPVRKAPVHWQASTTFNPAAVVKDGKVYLLYRAEEARSGDGRLTSRIGLAVSEDGFNFTQMPQPVLYPDEDDQKAHEWEGGCEDPRVVETEDGSYVMFYTQFEPGSGGRERTRLATATSRDLMHWTKRGPLIAKDAGTPAKSASLVCKVANGRLIAAKINGRYWLYHGRGNIGLLSSPDLMTWDAVPGRILDSSTGRAGKFDSGSVESGPPALLTDKGIVLITNGKNRDTALNDLDIPAHAYSCGQALFSASDPRKVLGRTDTPFIKPELSWEQNYQYRSNTVFAEGLVLFRGQWFLYYGSAETFVGVATAAAQ